MSAALGFVPGSRKRTCPQGVDPTTPAEWQEAADQAEFFLAFESARLYGLMDGGPGVNVARCLELLERARQRGIHPAPDAIERYAYLLAASCAAGVSP